MLLGAGERLVPGQSVAQSGERVEPGQARVLFDSLTQLLAQCRRVGDHGCGLGDVLAQLDAQRGEPAGCGERVCHDEDAADRRWDGNSQQRPYAVRVAERCELGVDERGVLEADRARGAQPFEPVERLLELEAADVRPGQRIGPGPASAAVANDAHLAGQGVQRDLQDVAERLVGVLGRQADDGAYRVQQLELVGQSLGRSGVLDRCLEQGAQLEQVLVGAAARQEVLRVAEHDEDVVAGPHHGAASTVIGAEQPRGGDIGDLGHLARGSWDQVDERVAAGIDLDDARPAPTAADPAQVRPGGPGHAAEDHPVAHAEPGRQVGDRLVQAPAVHCTRPRKGQSPISLSALTRLA